MLSRRTKVTIVVFVVTGLPIRRQLWQSTKLAIARWRYDWRATLTDVGASTYGQLFFWTLGQDFLGIGMDPKWRPGLGHRIAPQIARRLPRSAKLAWAIKFAEIGSDATKMLFEGRLYIEQGFTPDGMGAIFPQPVWSFGEVGEKIVGIILHPERVNTPEQITDSISSIYGTWSRNLLSVVQRRCGPRLRNKLGYPQFIVGPTVPMALNRVPDVWYPG